MSLNPNSVSEAVLRHCPDVLLRSLNHWALFLEFSLAHSVHQMPQFRSQLLEVFVWLVAGPTFLLGFWNALWFLYNQSRTREPPLLCFPFLLDALYYYCVVVTKVSDTDNLRGTDTYLAHDLAPLNLGLCEASWQNNKGKGMLISEYTGRIKKTRKVPCARCSRYLPLVGYFLQLGSTSQIPTTSSLLAGSLQGTKQSTFIW